MVKGRNCSLEYLLSKKWAEDIELVVDRPIYIIGGLYGNYQSLIKIKELANNETKQPLLVFNGDIHWFDIYEEDFLKVENFIESDIKLIGNVEYELLNKNNSLGCGCNYPEDVDEGIVNRSNVIHSLLKNNISNEEILKKIYNRTSTICLEYFGKKIAITHGDEKNMAGWQCSNENLRNYERQKEIENWLKTNEIDVLATTHTCLPAILNLSNKLVINNGAAGMANIKNSTFGLITRIANNKHKEALISKEIDNIFVELVKVDYDINNFINWFDSIWDQNSAASVSYRDRILYGTNMTKDDIIV